MTADGTIYTATRQQFNSSEAFLVAVNPNLTQKWMASLRNRFKDGCGVPISLGGTLPPNGAACGCPAGGKFGGQPATNAIGARRSLLNQPSPPVRAPGGPLISTATPRHNS